MIYCYPVSGKQKSLDICKAFAAGCGAQILVDAEQLQPGPAFFYGVDASNAHLWKAVRANAQQDFYYCDNSYFDDARQQYFRITKNRLQHTGFGVSNKQRFDDLGIDNRPLRNRGSHIVVCPQSDSFMETIVGYQGNWASDTMKALGGISKRSVRLRLWSGDKAKLASTLGEDLEGAHALVTWSSAAAITAVLSGVPAFVSKQCAAAPVANLALERMETPIFCGPAYIRNWAGVLADNQWTLDEMRRGIAWDALSRQGEQRG